jgi:hypothetical protein
MFTIKGFNKKFPACIEYIKEKRYEDASKAIKHYDSNRK